MSEKNGMKTVGSRLDDHKFEGDLHLRSMIEFEKPYIAFTCGINSGNWKMIGEFDTLEEAMKQAKSDSYNDRDWVVLKKIDLKIETFSKVSEK